MMDEPSRSVVDAPFEVISHGQPLEVMRPRRRRIRGKHKLFAIAFTLAFFIGTAWIVYTSPRTHREIPPEGIPVTAFHP
jgi:hypothetical protein